MKFSAIVWFIGMVLFAFLDGAIILFANNCTLLFSIAWWFSTLLGGITMCFSLYCQTYYFKMRKKRNNKFKIKHLTIAFVSNLLLMLFLSKL